MMLGLIVATPLLLSIMIAAGSWSRSQALTGIMETGMRLAPWASALLIWPVIEPTQVMLNWPLDGFQLRVDDVARPLLLLTAIAWTLAALMARSVIQSHRQSFWLGWLLSLTGMNLVLLAGDLIAFYFGYALLSLCSYLLIIHHRDDQAWRAGRIYLVLTLAGEGAVLAGVLLIAARLGNAELAELASSAAPGMHAITAWLLLIGLAVKLGIVPLHAWLPLAHPVAPVPASAILSGVIVKAGLLGWLRLVPSDLPSLASWTHLLLIVGLATAFGGIGLGLFQQRIKTVLAYSTISQMGLILTGFALSFQLPELRAEIIIVLGFFALHHGLNKTSLFMACGCAPGRSGWRMLMVVLPALSLSAAPLSTGYVAKKLLKHSVEQVELAATLVPILSLTSLATALLMWKLVGLAAAEKEVDAGAHPAWITLTLLALTVPWAWAIVHGLADPPTAAGLWAGTWPLLLAALIIAAWRQVPMLQGLAWRVPEGDWIVGAETLLLWFHSRRPALALARPPRHWWLMFMKRSKHLHRRIEDQLSRLPLAGLLMLSVTALLWWLLQ
ncbi:MAG: complex I subunit 5 family protein [Wenzhouxiangellaceae bacterium]|nr:complex I subunit 5 family protein [Wenzhouxiangellaceae bacterium]